MKNALAATEKLRRAELGAKAGDHVQYMLRDPRFVLAGGGGLGVGWSWNAAQCGPIWGYLPLKQLRRDRNQEDSPTVGSCANFFGTEEDEAAESFRKAWYLNFTEGPERVRRKLGNMMI